MNRLFRTFLPTVLLALAMSAQDLASVEAEGRREIRSDLAMTFAEKTVTEARQSYDAGKTDEFQKALDQFKRSLTLCFEALTENGKLLHRNAREPKRAELRMRALQRRVETLAQSVSIEDRPKVEEAAKLLTSYHDQLVTGILSKTKKNDGGAR